MYIFIIINNPNSFEFSYQYSLKNLKTFIPKIKYAKIITYNKIIIKFKNTKNRQRMNPDLNQEFLKSSNTKQKRNRNDRILQRCWRSMSPTALYAKLTLGSTWRTIFQ